MMHESTSELNERPTYRHYKTGSRSAEAMGWCATTSNTADGIIC